MTRSLRFVVVLFALCVPLLPRLYAQNAADVSRKLEALNAYPDLILVNAKINTLDSRLTQAQARTV